MTGKKGMKEPKRPMERKGVALKAKAERIYRRYCKGVEQADGAFAHVVKTLELEGHKVTSAKVRDWCRVEKWDDRVRGTDRLIYASLDVVREKRTRELTDTDYQDLMAVKSAVVELQDIAGTLLHKAGSAMEAFVPDTIADALAMAKTGQSLLESALKMREVLARIVPEAATTVSAQVDGKPVEAQILPAAHNTVPNLAAAVAQFERAAREGKKH